MATASLAYLLAGSLQAASPPALPRVTCASIETPQGTIIIDRIASVFFDSGSTRITEQASAILDNYAAHYDAPAHCHVFIAGHADRVGPASMNLELSRRRAAAVVAHLRNRGLAAPITLEALGETRPLVDTPDGGAEAQNRRVALFVGEWPAADH